MVAGRARRTLAVAAIGLLGLTAGCTTADAVPPGPEQAQSELPEATVEAMRSAVESAIAATRATGAIVGVWAPWAGSWTAAEGKASANGSEAMSVDMRFRIAENTKPMTCTVLLGLVDDGVVALGDPVKKYLPRMVGIDEITLRQLCEQTSGLGDYSTALRPQLVNNPTRPYVPLELITDGMGEPKAGSPGKTFSPSNAGFMVLGKALEKASGKNWSQLYEQYVFEPLGMTATSFPTGREQVLPEPHPRGYAFAVDASGALVCSTVRDESELSPTMAWTAGAVVSNLDDLHVFAGAFARGDLVSPQSEKQQWKTVTMGADVPSWEGYGLGGLQLGPLRGHAGQIPGFISAMLSDPDSGLTVVVMLNNSSAGSGLAQSLAMQLASIASKAPAKQGEAPVITLPWSDEQAAQAVQDAAVCPPEATPEPTPET